MECKLVMECKLSYASIVNDALSCDIDSNYGNTFQQLLLTNMSTGCRRRSPQKITMSPVF